MELTREQIRAARYPSQAGVQVESGDKGESGYRTTRKAPLRASTRISMIWAGFEELQEVVDVTSKDLPSLAELWGANLTTVKCQFYAWRATRTS